MILPHPSIFLLAVILLKKTYQSMILQRDATLLVLEQEIRFHYFIMGIENIFRLNWTVLIIMATITIQVAIIQAPLMGTR